MEEVWKDVVGYEDRYQVSNFGRIRSKDLTLHKSDNKVEFRKGRIVKLQLTKHGYLQYLFSNGTGNKRKLMSIHRVVAIAFIPNPLNKPNIDHINTIRTDNRVENLRWCTQSENNRNPITMTRYRKKGTYHHSEETKKKIGISGKGRKTSSKTITKLLLKGWPVVMFNKDGRFVAKYRTPSFAEKETKACKTHISACCNGKRKTAGGFQWRWEKEWDGKDISCTKPIKRGPHIMTEKRIIASKRGLDSAHKILSKPVLVYGIDGSFVCECTSVSDAARKFLTTSASVCRVCNGKLKSSKGLVFKYKKNDRN